MKKISCIEQDAWLSSGTVSQISKQNASAIIEKISVHKDGEDIPTTKLAQSVQQDHHLSLLKARYMRIGMINPSRWQSKL